MKKLHDNRMFSHPTTHGHKVNMCMSYQNFMSEKVLPTWFQGQMPEAPGEERPNKHINPLINRDDPRSQVLLDSMPKGQWMPSQAPKPGRLIRVPKTVIVSLHPYWVTATTKEYVFRFPIDVLGQMFTTGEFTNYYYLTQWDHYDFEDVGETAYGCDQSRQWQDPIQRSLVSNYSHSKTTGGLLSPGPSDHGPYYSQGEVDYCNATTDPTQGGVSNAPGEAAFSPIDSANMHSNRDMSFTRQAFDTYNKCANQGIGVPQPYETHSYSWPDDANGTYNEVVARVQNPYLQNCHEMFAAIDKLKAWINKKNPWGEWNVIVPHWIPIPWPQLRNTYLQLSDFVYDGRDWLLAELPCSHSCPKGWGPAFPDPRVTDLGFNGPRIPWLLCPEPAFGVDVLHIYIGHPNFSYTGGSAYQDYQAWPFSPEVGWIGPVQWWCYIPGWEQILDGPGPSTMFWGLRPIWRDYGFSYGYMSGAAGVMNYYGWDESMGETFQNNQYLYRGFNTMIFTFGKQWDFPWTPQELVGDHTLGCESPFFYFGSEFSDAVDYKLSHSDCPEDLTVTDHAYDSEPPLRIGSLQGYNVSACEIRNAIMHSFPPLKERVEAYYFSIETGSAEVFTACTSKIDNCNYMGPTAEKIDSDWLLRACGDWFARTPPVYNG